MKNFILMDEYIAVVAGGGEKSSKYSFYFLKEAQLFFISSMDFLISRISSSLNRKCFI